ncbi:O-antigen ligase family protein [Halomonas alkaliantarctica]|uniref:O-antigen ligase family protein n=1 Tax=Halomonas alkaliantarctica TaxID=232346 RepID=UPI0004AB0A73|nr:O-antigen ligase family protein [Halomonas alkaliantarctica]
MDVKVKTCLDITLLVFLILWPVVDTLNGYFYYQEAAIPSISAPYKALGFIGIVLMLLVYHPWRFFQLFIMIVLVVTSIAYQKFAYGAVTESITWAVRGLLALALLFYLIGESVKDSFWSRRKIASLMLLYFVAMAANVALGVFGFGESQYAGGIGGKGFIIAGNEMSYLMLASASVVLFYIAENRNAWVLSGVFILLLFFFLMKATKVAMIGICLAYIYALIHGGYFNVKRIPVIYIAGLIGTFAVLVLGYQFIQATGLLDRILYLYSLHGGFWGALLSGRITFVQTTYNSVIINFSFWDVLLGVGVDQLRAVTGSIVEIDIIDVWVAFGVVGPILFYFPWLLGIGYSISIFQHSANSSICFLLLIAMIIGVSLTAGHVVNSGIASSATALLIAYLYMLKMELLEAKGA